MNTKRKNSHAFTSNYNQNILDDMNLIDSHREFEISNKFPGTICWAIEDLSNNVMIVMEEQNHESLLFTFSWDCKIEMNVFLIIWWVMLICYSFELNSIIFLKDSECFISLWEIRGLKMINSYLWIVQG